MSGPGRQAGAAGAAPAAPTPSTTTVKMSVAVGPLLQ